MLSIDEWHLVVKTIGECVCFLFFCSSLLNRPRFLPHSDARDKQEEEEIRAKNPTIRDQFADAKRQLATLSESDWENIPEPVRIAVFGLNFQLNLFQSGIVVSPANRILQGDYSRQNKHVTKMAERFMPVPDSVLQTAAASATVGAAATADPLLGASGAATSLSGQSTPYTDFMQIGGARKQVLGLNLDRV
jgi:pre-mRNA-processing factor 6